MKLKGTVKNIVYEANDSLYKVLSVDTKEDGNISVTGYFPQIDEKGYYEFEGDTTLHPKYGLQFQAKSYVPLAHTTLDGVVSYLSSSKFKGIGEKTAKKIVEELGINAIDLIKSDKDCLTKIKGITSSKAIEIYNAVKENEKAEHIFIKLFSYGLTPHMANIIYSKYEELTISKIEENPYTLIYDISGFGFKKCDDLALKIGFKEDNITRIKEAILYSINERIDRTGDTFLTFDQTLDSSCEILNSRSKELIFNKNDLSNYLIDLINDNRVVKVDNRIYLKRLYEAESGSANILLDLVNYKFENINKDRVKELISEAEEYLEIKLTDEQKSAIFNSITNKVSIITGGPGTGKTTIMKCFLYVKAALMNLDVHDTKFERNVLLLAPTGRASKRLQIQTGIKAQTIHKALEYNEFGGFNKGLDNKLSENLIIIDESSMIDVELLYHLLEALLITSQIVFVGDFDQLPSVGAGNVLEDLINSKKIVVSRLTEIMRQKEDSDIIKLSQMINNKNIDYSIFNNKKEVFFYQIEEKNVVNLIIKILDRYNSLHNDLYYDMQVLAPMYSGLCGIDELNRQIQAHFNKSERFIKSGDNIFKEGDKVLQLVNNPQLKIMNGDIGIIKVIQKTNDGTYLYIDFDQNIIKYPQSNLSDLALGYAISIHKSQGSEYKNVIIPLVSSFRIMLRKKLIYTAITRAKEKVIIIGNPNAISYALYQNEEIRQTSLARLINPNLVSKSYENHLISNSVEKEEKIQYIRINDSDSAFMYIKEDLNGLTPYDCMEEVGGNKND